jgi:RuvB-like protein 2
MAQCLGRGVGDLPFTMITGSELYSAETSVVEALTQAVRRTIGLRLYEEVSRVEGEVVSVVLETRTGGQQRGTLTLRTTEMESIFDMGPRLADAVQRERIQPGDILRIDKTNGSVKRLGRTRTRVAAYDAVGPESSGGSARFLPCPSGELLQKKRMPHIVTLHEMDVLNESGAGSIGAGSAVPALFSGATGEISVAVRRRVDETVTGWLLSGKAELLAGVLFIDEAHLLDLPCCTFLHRVALAASLAPLLVLATSVPASPPTPIRAAYGQTGPHGLPSDFVDRLLPIRTEPYSAKELDTILAIRADCENVPLAHAARPFLTNLGMRTSLRYAALLIAVAHRIAIKEAALSSSSSRAKVTIPSTTPVPVDVAHLERATALFWDPARSIQACTDTFLR